jgi:hypothetical protein
VNIYIWSRILFIGKIHIVEIFRNLPNFMHAVCLCCNFDKAILLRMSYNIFLYFELFYGCFIHKKCLYQYYIWRLNFVNGIVYLNSLTKLLLFFSITEILLSESKKKQTNICIILFGH